MVDKLTSRTVQQQDRAARSDEDLRKWCVEQAISAAYKSDPFDGNLIALARKIEDYVRGRITTP